MAAPYPTLAVGGTPSTASNLGSTAGRQGVYASEAGSVFQFKSLIPGAGAGASVAGGELTLSAPGTNVTLASAGGTSLVSAGTGPALAVKGVSAGTRASVTASGTALTVAGNPAGETNTASNLGTGAQFYSTKVGVDLRFRSLVGSGSLTVTQNTNDITLSYAVPGLPSFPWFVSHAVSSGIAGGTATASTWLPRTLTTVTGNSGANVQLAVAPAGINQIRITTGTYWVSGYSNDYNCGPGVATRLQNITTGATAAESISDQTTTLEPAGSDCSNDIEMCGVFTVSAAAEVFELQNYSKGTVSTNGYGLPTSVTGQKEVYAVLAFRQLS